MDLKWWTSKPALAALTLTCVAGCALLDLASEPVDEGTDICTTRGSDGVFCLPGSVCTSIGYYVDNTTTEALSVEGARCVGFMRFGEAFRPFVDEISKPPADLRTGPVFGRVEGPISDSYHVIDFDDHVSILSLLLDDPKVYTVASSELEADDEGNLQLDLSPAPGDSLDVYDQASITANTESAWIMAGNEDNQLKILAQDEGARPIGEVESYDTLLFDGWVDAERPSVVADVEQVSQSFVVGTRLCETMTLEQCSIVFARFELGAYDPGEQEYTVEDADVVRARSVNVMPDLPGTREVEALLGLNVIDDRTYSLLTVDSGGMDGTQSLAMRFIRVGEDSEEFQVAGRVWRANELFMNDEDGVEECGAHRYVLGEPNQQHMLDEEARVSGDAATQSFLSMMAPPEGVPNVFSYTRIDVEGGLMGEVDPSIQCVELSSADVPVRLVGVAEFDSSPEQPKFIAFFARREPMARGGGESLIVVRSDETTNIDAGALTRQVFEFLEIGFEIIDVTTIGPRNGDPSRIFVYARDLDANQIVSFELTDFDAAREGARMRLTRRAAP